MDRTTLPIVTVFGASGFVGTQVVQALARKGHRIRAAVRRPDLALHLKPLGDVGQIVPIQANVRFPDSVARAVTGAGIVINLVGVGFERGAQRFAKVNVDGARNVAQAARAAGVETLVHMSILGADPHSPSGFARSRAYGEAAVVESFPEAVIMRPSIIFGTGDGFISRMAGLARLFPVLPLIGGRTRFQPVFVGDVAEAIAWAAEGVGARGRVYELGGPEVLTHRALMQEILRQTNRSNLLLPIPEGLGFVLAAPLSLLPTPILTADQVRLLAVDNVVSDAAARDGRTLAAFGVTPTTMEAVLPSYLWRFRRHGQFDRLPA
jgi:NADH dehydrogenase